MIVRVPKRQKPSRNDRNDPYPRLNLHTIKGYIVITCVHQNPNFPPWIRKKIRILRGYCGGVKPGPMMWAQEQRFINNTPEEKKS